MGWARAARDEMNAVPFVINDVDVDAVPLCRRAAVCDSAFRVEWTCQSLRDLHRPTGCSLRIMRERCAPWGRGEGEKERRGEEV